MGNRRAALLRHEARSATFVTPERKTTLWNALSRLAASPIQERTLTGLRTLVQDKAIKDALASYCLEQYATKLAAGGIRRRIWRWCR